MNVFHYMVQLLQGHRVIVPNIGTLVAKCRGNCPQWLTPKKKAKR